MEISRWDPKDAGARRGLGCAADLLNEARDVDCPWVHDTTVEGLDGAWTYGHDGEPPLTLIGRQGDRLQAVAWVNMSTWDNLDSAWVGVVVRPTQRGRGLGTEMLQHTEKVAGEHRRSKLGAGAWDGTPGVEFLLRQGYVKKSQAVNRRQHLREIGTDVFRQLHERAAEAAPDYELLRINGLTPEELLAPLALASASINDAPLDDLDFEDENYDPERVRLYEEMTLKRRRRLYRVVARHRPTGELAGHTVVVVESTTPEIAHQHDTAVVPDHRGHRLGLLLKAEAVLWLAEEEPQVQTVDTWNAESNKHMIQVNEQLGYRWMGRELQFQKA